MEEGDTEKAFSMLYQANDSFGNVAPHISDPTTQAYFEKVYGEFGPLLNAGNLTAIDEYMKNAYPQFRSDLGCPISSPIQ